MIIIVKVAAASCRLSAIIAAGCRSYVIGESSRLVPCTPRNSESLEARPRSIAHIVVQFGELACLGEIIEQADDRGDDEHQPEEHITARAVARQDHPKNSEADGQRRNRTATGDGSLRPRSSRGSCISPDRLATRGRCVRRFAVSGFQRRRRFLRSVFAGLRAPRCRSLRPSDQLSSKSRIRR